MTFNQANELLCKWAQVQQWEYSELTDAPRRYDKALAEFDKAMMQSLRAETISRALQIIDAKAKAV